MTIDYIARWDKHDERLSWSGTTYNLLNALEAQVKVTRIDAPYLNLYDKIRLNILRKHSEFDTEFQRKRSNSLIKQLNNRNNEVLQVGDITQIEKSFVYIDLSLTALKWVKNSDQVAFNYSGYAKYSNKVFDERLDFQETFFGMHTTILTMSHWLEKFLQKQGYTNTHYVGGGINTPIVDDTKLIRNKKQILFVGRDLYRKGGDIVIEAFQELKREDSEVELIVAGPEKLPKQYRNIEGLIFLGPVSYEKVSYLMRTSTIFAMPARFEAYGLVFLEAMANGMPIIARDKFEMPFFVAKGCGLLINSESKEKETTQMYKSLKIMLSNPSFLTKASKYSENIRLEFSWNKVAERMLNWIKVE